MRQEDFVTYELAVKLKEKGYPQNNCFRCYFVGDDKVRGCSVGDVIHRSYKGEKHLIAAPTIEQVLKWLREEKKIHVTTGVTPKSAWRYVIMFCDERGFKEPTIIEKNHSDYSSAIIAGIEYVLDNLI